MKALDLFSGIGGFALAGHWVWGEDYQVQSFVEFDKACQELLNVRFPGVPVHPNVKDFDGTKYTDIDILTGGFPCQPFSAAGKRKGTEDDRYLWPEMYRIIKEARPRWVLAENVRGLVTWNEGMVLDTVLSDLENEGYETQSFVIPACAVEAPHRRDRVWIVANYAGVNWNGVRDEQCGEVPIEKLWGEQPRGFNLHSYDSTWNLQRRDVCESAICREDGRIPRRVDRLKQLGNAIVPQVAEQIMKAIKQVAIPS
jgi:DNA (cytosine-5)-methyltransferase 1